MNFYVMTLFPEMITNALSTSITGRAMEHGLIQVHAVNIRDYTTDKHKRVDDYPYGGGAGMVMQAQPIYDCYQAICKELRDKQSVRSTDKPNKATPRVIYLTPQGEVFHQKMAEELAQEEDLIFLCGHYEGIDERALELIVTDNISIGDYVLTGGELPALVMTDAIVRLIPGAIGDEQSALSDSFQDNLLAPPIYTRPADYNGWKVPDILLSGHEAKIAEWRHEQSLERTRRLRPDLLEEMGM